MSLLHSIMAPKSQGQVRRPTTPSNRPPQANPASMQAVQNTPTMVVNLNMSNGRSSIASNQPPQSNVRNSRLQSLVALNPTLDTLNLDQGASNGNEFHDDSGVTADVLPRPSRGQSRQRGGRAPQRRSNRRRPSPYDEAEEDNEWNDEDPEATEGGSSRRRRGRGGGGANAGPSTRVRFIPEKKNDGLDFCVPIDILVDRNTSEYLYYSSCEEREKNEFISKTTVERRSTSKEFSTPEHSENNQGGFHKKHRVKDDFDEMVLDLFGDTRDSPSNRDIDISEEADEEEEETLTRRYGERNLSHITEQNDVKQEEDEEEAFQQPNQPLLINPFTHESRQQPQSQTQSQPQSQQQSQRQNSAPTQDNVMGLLAETSKTMSIHDYVKETQRSFYKTCGRVLKEDDCLICSYRNKKVSTMSESTHLDIIIGMVDNLAKSNDIDVEKAAQNIHRFYMKFVYLPSLKTDNKMPLWRTWHVLYHIEHHMDDPIVYVKKEMKLTKQIREALLRMCINVRKYRDGEKTLVPNSEAWRYIESASKRLDTLYNMDPKKMMFNKNVHINTDMVGSMTKGP